MDSNQEVWFPDVDFFENVVTSMVPVLFPSYEDSSPPDFQYLGGSHGSGLLESALAQPQQTFDGEYLYLSIADKAAALLWSVTKNHPFNDGNKRAGLTACIFFLAFNRYVLLATQSEAVELCLKVAASEPGIDQGYVSTWISERIFNLSEFDPDNVETADYWRRYFQTASYEERNALSRFYRAIDRILRILAGRGTPEN